MTWRDISTAPRDGTPILAWLRESYPEQQGPTCYVVQWGVMYDDWHEAGGECYWRPEVTHWMPLPPPPTEE